MPKVNLDASLAAISEFWRPRVIAELNGQEVKVSKFKGEFIWHRHDEADEMFLALRGRFRIEFRDRVETLEPGDLLVVPRGVEHRPVADEEVAVLLFEPAGTRNTGNVVHETLTAPAGPSPAHR
jgi:mannose-6-phosphate isomerase-like protein (cupin superfamily)